MSSSRNFLDLYFRISSCFQKLHLLFSFFSKILLFLHVTSVIWNIMIHYFILLATFEWLWCSNSSIQNHYVAWKVCLHTNAACKVRCAGAKLMHADINLLLNLLHSVHLLFVSTQVLLHNTHTLKGNYNPKFLANLESWKYEKSLVLLLF